MPVSAVLTSLIPQLGSGGLLGFAGGYIVKKLAKIFLYVAGFFLALIAGGVYWAEAQGWVTVTINWNAISASANTWIQSAVNAIGPVLASVTAFSGAAGAGFLLGIRQP